MEKKRTSVLIGCILGLALFFMSPMNAAASDLVCDPYIIAVGERKFDILSKCGAPAYTETRVEERIRRWNATPWTLEPARRSEPAPLFTREFVTLEEWEYNFGPNRFIRYLRFENGRLTRITTGDYGY